MSKNQKTKDTVNIETAAIKSSSHGDENACHICAEPSPKYWAISECNHRICWMCSLRLRVLYEKTTCAMCLADCEQVFIGKQAGKLNYEQVMADGGMKRRFDQERSLVFESEEVERDVRELLKLKCPFTGCKTTATTCFSSKQDLRRHTSSTHSLLLCDICLAHKRVFSSEMRLFNQAALQRHQKDHHPTCKICGTLFFSEEELGQHYREKHEQCHVCWRRDPQSAPYYRDYYSLEDHFRKDHYLCPERLCLDMKFVVFGSEIEYKSHMAEVHLSHTKMQRSQHKQLTKIDPSFMVESTRTSAASSAPSSTGRAVKYTLTEPPPSPQPVAPPAPTVAVDTSKLFFGDSIASLAGKLASLALYEQRNEEFFTSLRQAESMSPDSIRQLQTTCRIFQEGQGILAQEWVRRVFEQLGVERAKRILPALIELQLDQSKRNEMAMAVRMHLHKLEAFPPLPSTSAAAHTAAAPATHTPSYLAGGSKPKITLGPAVKTVRLSSKGGPVHDPSKNPLGLSGFGSGRGSKPAEKKKAPAPPGFSQAAATGTGTSMSSVPPSSSFSISAPPVRQLDESQFPSLPSSKPAKPTAIPDAPSGNAFVQNTGGAFDDDADGFVIGAGSSPSTNEAVQASDGKKKKTKRQVVLRFG